MRNNREEHYGDFSRRYEQEHPQERQWHHEQQRHNRRGEDRDPGRRYRAQQSQEYGRRGGERGMHEDYYNTMYDTSNYTGMPRDVEYGLPRGAENDLDRVSRGDWRYANPDDFDRTRYRYSSGYNPNFDNPEEGDMYRNFDSRGNFGYRHDPSYGSADEFRDFGDDHYGRSDESRSY